MKLSEVEIQECILNPRHKADIDSGIKLQNEHKVHVTGDGYEDILKSTIGTTRAIQYGGERELSKPVTLFLTKKLKDELSRWKNTQGTRKTYDFGENQEMSEKFRRDVMSIVWKNGGIDRFSDFINDALYTDFNGFAIVERGVMSGAYEIRDGIPQKPTKVPYIIFKGLDDVHDYQLNGEKVEYLILKFKGKDKTRQLFRVLDDTGDYIYQITNVDQEKRVELAPDYSILTNVLGYVPAIQIGMIRANPLNDHVRTSHIYQTLPLLQDYMTSHAEHIISKILHAHPILALIGQKCRYKDQHGNSCANGRIWTEGGKEEDCPKCGGVGAVVPQTSSEVIILPEVDAQGSSFNMTNIGQYITPPTEILKYQSTELDELEQRIIYSGTGIKTLVRTEMQTATEIVLNLKPLEDKISVLLDNIELVESFLTDCIGKMWSEKYVGCQIFYGRKLNIRDENLILQEIEASKRSGMPLSQIRLLVQELIITRNRNSKQDLERALILLDLEPGAILSVEEVQTSPYIDEKTKCYKLNFDDYIDRFEVEYMPITLFMAGRKWKERIESIRKILDGYNEKRYKDLESERSRIPQGDDGGRPNMGSPASQATGSGRTMGTTTTQGNSSTE